MEGHELAWDATLESDGPEYSLLPEGEYNFRVLSMERQRYQGGTKLRPCSVAVLKILITAPDGKSTVVTHRLYLESTVENLLSAFFRSIGEKKRGQAVAMNWAHVVDGEGRCRVGIRVGNDGNQYNEIKRFLDPEDGAAPAPAVGWNTGAFGG